MFYSEKEDNKKDRSYRGVKYLHQHYTFGLEKFLGLRLEKIHQSPEEFRHAKDVRSAYFSQHYDLDPRVAHWLSDRIIEWNINNLMTLTPEQTASIRYRPIAFKHRDISAEGVLQDPSGPFVHPNRIRWEAEQPALLGDPEPSDRAGTPMPTAIIMAKPAPQKIRELS